jgi:hypothetical protein
LLPAFAAVAKHYPLTELVSVAGVS